MNYEGFSKNGNLLRINIYKNSQVTSTIGARMKNLTIEKYWKTDVYNTIIDNITNIMKTSFSDESQKLEKIN